MRKDFLCTTDLTPEETARLFDLAADVKANPGRYSGALSGRSLAMIFQKSSTRTRVSFEVGMTQMGGHALFLSPNDMQIGRGETVGDTARVLSRYVDAIMARVFAHKDVEELARHATVPVVNGLSDYNHPCQALADFLTLREHKGTLQGLRIAWVGDGNNVAHSVVLLGARTGVSVSLACPEGYEPDAGVLQRASEEGARTGAKFQVVRHPDEIVRGVDAVFTDVWVSMGQDAEKEKRRKVFAPYQVNAALMAKAGKDALFLHCLPAHRGEEVTDEVVDSAQSVVLDEAENRMHTQQALLLMLPA